MTEIVILAKEPIVGNVKSRLGMEIGMSKAAEIHCILSFHTLEIALQSQLPVSISLGGSLQSPFAQKLRNSGAELFAQPPGDLGKKIHHAMQRADRVIALGIDCPLLQAEDLQQASQLTDLIFGVAEDGGYWMIAANRPPEKLFQNISWSTNKVLQQSLQQAKKAKLQPKLFPIRYDIDTLCDLHRLLHDPLCPPLLYKRLSPYA